MAATMPTEGQGGVSFIISTNAKFSQAQLHTLAEAGMQQGMPFKISAEGALQATDESARRRKVKTLRNHGTVDSSSVALESVMVPGEGVRYALQFKYSASEDMNAKVFFHAKDFNGKLAIRSKLDGVKKWDDIVLPAGRDMMWDSSTADREGLFLSDEDPVFVRLRNAKGDAAEVSKSKNLHLYDVVIVLSFLNSNSLYSSDERRSEQSTDKPVIESPQYSVNPMKNAFSPSGKSTEGLDSGEIELRSGRVSDMRRKLDARWAVAKESMLQGFGSLRKNATAPGESDSSSTGSGGNSDFITCEKTKCRLVSLPDGDWIPPPAPKKVSPTIDRTEEEDVRIRLPGDRFGSLRHKYSAGTSNTSAGNKVTDSSISPHQGKDRRNRLVRGPILKVDCVSQALLYNDEEYLSKEVFGGTWENLCPAIAAESVVEDKYSNGNGKEGEIEVREDKGRAAVVAGDRDSEAKDDTRKPEQTNPHSSQEVIDFRESEDKSESVATSAGKKNSLFDEEDADYQDSYCVICMSAPRQVIVHPCNHCCVCSSCATVLSANVDGFSSSTGRNNQIKCPMCRVQLTAMIYLRDRKNASSTELPVHIGKAL